MSEFITPIFDRTHADITNLTAKAYMNVADWLRIYGNAKLAARLVATLNGYPIQFDEVAAPTIYTFPKVEDLNLILANIERVRVAANLPPTTGLIQVVANWAAGYNEDSPGYEDANTWERVIALVVGAMQATADHKVQCGIAYPGQPRFWQNRFIKHRWVQPAASPVRRHRCGLTRCGASLMRNNRWRNY